jgi:hypothetical protein
MFLVSFMVRSNWALLSSGSRNILSDNRFLQESICSISAKLVIRYSRKAAVRGLFAAGTLLGWQVRWRSLLEYGCRNLLAPSCTALRDRLP